MYKPQLISKFQSKIQKKSRKIAKCQYDYLLKTVIPQRCIHYTTPSLLQNILCIWYSRGAIAERFTDISENARDVIFSHAYLYTDFG